MISCRGAGALIVIHPRRVSIDSAELVAARHQLGEVIGRACVVLGADTVLLLPGEGLSFSGGKPLRRSTGQDFCAVVWWQRGNLGMMRETQIFPAQGSFGILRSHPLGILQCLCGVSGRLYRLRVGLAILALTKAQPVANPPHDGLFHLLQSATKAFPFIKRRSFGNVKCHTFPRDVGNNLASLRVDDCWSVQTTPPCNSRLRQPFGQDRQATPSRIQPEGFPPCIS